MKLLTLLKEELGIQTLPMFIEELNKADGMHGSTLGYRNELIEAMKNAYPWFRGDYRLVFDIGGGRVLKVAYSVRGSNNKDGCEQNKNEQELSMCSGSKFVTQVYSSGNNHNWIMAERVDHLTGVKHLEQLLQSKLGFAVTYLYFKKMLEDGSNQVPTTQGKKYLALRNKNGWFKGLTDALRDCNIESSDLHYRNWGIRTSTSELVILDYGFKRMN